MNIKNKILEKVREEKQIVTNTKKKINVRYFRSLMSVQTPTSEWMTSK